MSNIKDTVKETAGAAEEELGELIGNDKMANQGRKLRNEGRVGNLKPPKMAPVGSEKP